MRKAELLTPNRTSDLRTEWYKRERQRNAWERTTKGKCSAGRMEGEAERGRLVDLEAGGRVRAAEACEARAATLGDARRARGAGWAARWAVRKRPARARRCVRKRPARARRCVRLAQESRGRADGRREDAQGGATRRWEAEAGGIGQESPAALSSSG
jgi:hypothetical protein